MAANSTLNQWYKKPCLSWRVMDGIEVNRLIKFFVYYVICIGMSYASIHA